MRSSIHHWWAALKFCCQQVVNADQLKASGGSKAREEQVMRFQSERASPGWVTILRPLSFPLHCSLKGRLMLLHRGGTDEMQQWPYLCLSSHQQQRSERISWGFLKTAPAFISYPRWRDQWCYGRKKLPAWANFGNNTILTWIRLMILFMV